MRGKQKINKRTPGCFKVISHSRMGMAYQIVYGSKNYFFFSSFFSILVSVAVDAAGFAVSAGFAAPAFIVSAAGAGAGAGAAGAAVVLVAVESVVFVSVLPPPQDATNRPNERASTLNFTNFIILFF
jgi:hypothetical protein